MSAPFNPIVTPDLGELTNALGNAALKTAQKGAMASDAEQARGYAQASQAFVEALMAIIAPKLPPAPPQSRNGASGASKDSQTQT